MNVSPGIAKSYYTYFCARFDYDSELIRPKFEIWSGVYSKVCWLEAGNSGLYVPNVTADTPEELAKQLYLHKQEISERGENIMFKNQVPPTYSDIYKSHMRTSIPPDLVFKVFLEMKRLDVNNPSTPVRQNL